MHLLCHSKLILQTVCSVVYFPKYGNMRMSSKFIRKIKKKSEGELSSYRPVTNFWKILEKFVYDS